MEPQDGNLTLRQHKKQTKLVGRNKLLGIKKRNQNIYNVAD